MKIFVLRHGETEENITGILQGNMDTILNQKGESQALAARDEVSKHDIDLIIASPKKRTIKTASLAAPNIPLITDDRLLSRNHGEFEGKRRDEININDYWNFAKNNEYEKAESVHELYNRIDSLLKEIKEKYKNKKILLVTHSGICRILYYYFNGIPESGDLMEYKSHNCSFEQYEL